MSFKVFKALYGLRLMFKELQMSLKIDVGSFKKMSQDVSRCPKVPKDVLRCLKVTQDGCLKITQDVPLDEIRFLRCSKMF